MATQTATKPVANAKPERKRFADLSPEQQEKILAARRAKFSELASKRTSNAITRIRQLVALGNKQQYAWTDDQAAKIIAALNGAVFDVKSALSGTKSAAATFTV